MIDFLSILPGQIIPRDDGMYDVMRRESTAGPFPTITFALPIASGHPPAPAPATKFRRFEIRRARDAASSA